MSKYDNQFRLSTAFALAVVSVGGAATSTTSLSAQCYNVQLCYPGSVSSTGGCRIAIVSPNDNLASSTQGTLIYVTRCTPWPSRAMAS
jgi:hypothetical protein